MIKLTNINMRLDFLINRCVYVFENV